MDLNRKSDPWFALQVRSRYENIVAAHLGGKAYEWFLPLYKCRRRWSDPWNSLSLVPEFTPLEFAILTGLATPNRFIRLLLSAAGVRSSSKSGVDTMDAMSGWTESMDHFQARICSSRVDEDIEDHMFIAACPAMTRVRSEIEHAAGVDFPVLLLGETGVGKDFAARLIHDLSPRAHGSFLKVSCAASPADLLERELFGCEAMAAFQANRGTPGKVELCDRGTILLDEVGELPAGTQAKLLQMIDDQTFVRPDSQSPVTVDVRVLVASDTKIEQTLATKRFREDLYDRLSVLSIHIPPLRERAEEIPLLFRHFLKKYKTRFQMEAPEPSEHLLRAARRYPWPGNLHELENFVKRYVIAKSPSQEGGGGPFEFIEMAAAQQRIPHGRVKQQ
jgi:DNA-binding NtrC family response regulator